MSRPGRRSLPSGIVAGHWIEAAGTFLLTTLEQKVIDAVDADDRQWLSDHPERTYRLRPALPDEIPAGALTESGWDIAIGTDEAWFVVVTRGLVAGTASREYRVYPLPVPAYVRLDPIEGAVL